MTALWVHSVIGRYLGVKWQDWMSIGWHFFFNNTANWLTLTNSNIQYMRQIQSNMFHRFKKICEKAQSGLGLERPQETLKDAKFQTFQVYMWVAENNHKKWKDPLWVSLWNGLRCPLMNNRWIKWNRQKYMNRYVHMLKKAITCLWQWQRSKGWWGTSRGSWLRWEPRTHPLPLPVLPEDTVNATLKEGPV